MAVSIVDIAPLNSFAVVSISLGAFATSSLAEYYFFPYATHATQRVAKFYSNRAQQIAIAAPQHQLALTAPTAAAAATSRYDSLYFWWETRAHTHAAIAYTRAAESYAMASSIILKNGVKQL